MATQSITTGGCEAEDDGDGSQGTADHNYVPQQSTSPEPLATNAQSNQKQIKTRPYPSKDNLPQKVHIDMLRGVGIRSSVFYFISLNRLPPNFDEQNLHSTLLGMKNER